MKKIILVLVTFSSLSAFANPCAEADLSCPTKGLLTEAQSLGRVCLALEKGKIGSYRFLSHLKRSLNACKKYDQEGNEAAYLDIPLTEDSFSRCQSVSEVAEEVRLGQRQVFN